jgi:hypothetical protein
VVEAWKDLVQLFRGPDDLSDEECEERRRFYNLFALIVGICVVGGTLLGVLINISDSGETSQVVAEEPMVQLTIRAIFNGETRKWDGGLDHTMWVNPSHVIFVRPMEGTRKGAIVCYAPNTLVQVLESPKTVLVALGKEFKEEGP